MKNPDVENGYITVEDVRDPVNVDNGLCPYTDDEGIVEEAPDKDVLDSARKKSSCSDTCEHMSNQKFRLVE